MTDQTRMRGGNKTFIKYKVYLSEFTRYTCMIKCWEEFWVSTFYIHLIFRLFNTWKYYDGKQHTSTQYRYKYLKCTLFPCVKDDDDHIVRWHFLVNGSIESLKILKKIFKIICSTGSCVVFFVHSLHYIL